MFGRIKGKGTRLRSIWRVGTNEKLLARLDALQIYLEAQHEPYISSL